VITLLRNLEQLASCIDHTKLGPAVTPAEIIRLCQEAKTYGFATVCVAPIYVALAKEQLQGTNVGVCTVVGFPFGTHTMLTKALEAKEAVLLGATEIDMVLNIGALRAGNLAYAQAEVKQVVETVRDLQPLTIVKVIIETCLLSETEKKAACQVVLAGGADFVKTSTGFSTHGATIDDVTLLAQTVAKRIGVKASGGIRKLETALAMLQAGATRLGTSSGVQIMEEARQAAEI